MFSATSTKRCEICGENFPAGILTRHLKEKHTSYYRAFVKHALLMAAVGGFGSVLLIFTLITDLAMGSLSLSVRIYLPTLVITLLLVWRLIDRRLRNLRKSLKESWAKAEASGTIKRADEG